MGNIMTIVREIMIKKRTILSVLLGCFTASAAAVIPMSNQEKDGFPLLVPEVPKLEKTGGVFRLPAEFTVRLPASATVELEQLTEELARFPGIKVRAVAPGEQAVCRLRLLQNPGWDRPARPRALPIRTMGRYSQPGGTAAPPSEGVLQETLR